MSCPTSSIRLSDLKTDDYHYISSLLQKKYAALSKYVLGKAVRQALESVDIVTDFSQADDVWQNAGPANRRHFSGAQLASLGGIAKEFVDFLSSAEFIKFLKQVREMACMQIFRISHPLPDNPA